MLEKVKNKKITRILKSILECASTVTTLFRVRKICQFGSFKIEIVTEKTISGFFFLNQLVKQVVRGVLYTRSI